MNKKFLSMDITINVQKNVAKSLKGGLTYVMGKMNCEKGSFLYKKVWKNKTL